jgi:hypothetical protein
VRSGLFLRALRFRRRGQPGPLQPGGGRVRRDCGCSRALGVTRPCLPQKIASTTRAEQEQGATQDQARCAYFGCWVQCSQSLVLAGQVQVQGGAGGGSTNSKQQAAQSSKQKELKNSNSQHTKHTQHTQHTTHNSGIHLRVICPWQQVLQLAHGLGTSICMRVGAVTPRLAEAAAREGLM